MRVSNILIISTMVLIAFSGMASAAMDHSFIEGPFETGPQVTVKCITCHPDAANEMLDSAHWNWAGPTPDVVGHETETTIGKTNVINNYCIAVPSNEPRCTSCHVGYGWKDSTFDFTDKTNIDCLVCHDGTGTYKKIPTGAGAVDGGVDLEAVAQSVGMPTRDTCGGCHFNGGGGDNVKHGDMSSALSTPSEDLDVHMSGTDGLLCQDCHTTTEHKIAGFSTAVPVTEGRVDCTDCHDAAPHTGPFKDKLDSHSDAIACQTCHIPKVAQEVPTKMNWDWSTAGQDIDPIPIDEYGKPTYFKLKGNFVWGMDIVPTYAWYNGKVERYILGDEVNQNGVTSIVNPVGDINDPDAKIYPFKIHEAKQISDAVNNYLIVPKLFGEGGYWKTFDWNAASELGMETVDLPYSGEYEFISTEMYMSLNHEVAPKEAALGCSDCHTEDSRIDFVALGYSGDPVDVGPRFAVAEEPEAPVEDVEEEAPAGTPGFEAALALVGLLGAVLLARRD